MTIKLQNLIKIISVHTPDAGSNYFSPLCKYKSGGTIQVIHHICGISYDCSKCVLSNDANKLAAIQILLDQGIK